MYFVSFPGSWFLVPGSFFYKKYDPVFVRKKKEYVYKQGKEQQNLSFSLLCTNYTLLVFLFLDNFFTKNFGFIFFCLKKKDKRRDTKRIDSYLFSLLCKKNIERKNTCIVYFLFIIISLYS